MSWAGGFLELLARAGDTEASHCDRGRFLTWHAFNSAGGAGQKGLAMSEVFAGRNRTAIFWLPLAPQAPSDGQPPYAVAALVTVNRRVQVVNMEKKTTASK
jgi:hypothetical protein